MTFTPAAQATTPTRPKWLTLAAVGVIVVSAFAILGGLSAIGGFILGRHHPFAGMPGAPPEVAKMIELQQKMMSGPAPALTLTAGIVGIAVGAWALYSAVRVLGAKPGARATFRRAVVALAAVEVVGLVLGVWMQIKSYEMFGEIGEAFFSSAPAPHGMDKMMKTFMQGGVLVGMVFAVGYGVLKIGFLAWSHWYAGSREVAAHLEMRDGNG